MPRFPFLRSAPVALLFLGVPVLGACGGHVLSLGTNDSQLQKLDPGTVSGNAPACPKGYAHPNVCCQISAGQPSECGAWIEHPFQACDPGWTTYPNPLECCSLTNDKDCVETLQDAGVPAPPPYGCGYVCPPGYYVPPGVTVSPDQGECCTTGPDGAQACFGWATASAGVAGTGTASGGGTSTPDQPPCVETADAGPAPCACACPANDPNCPCDCDGGAAPDADVDADVDAGTPTPMPPVPDDASCPPPPQPVPPPSYDGGPYGMCDPCPDGWTSDPSKPDLCCRIDANGVNECFSQATGPISGPPTDAGPAPTPVPAPVACGGSGSGPNGAGDSCSCQSTDANGQTDTIDCSADSAGNTTCFCEAGGKTISQLSPGAAICSDPQKLQSLFSSCFPTH